MALPAYLSLTSTRGPVRGGALQAGHEGEIFVLQAFHEIVAPRDPVRGTPTGKRAHKPFNVMKAVDQATPALMAALTQNETLPTWRLAVYRPSPEGLERLFFTIELFDATVSSVRLHLPSTRQPRLAAVELYEVVQFTYRRIEWTNLDGNTSAIDDWDAPRIR